MQPWTAASSAHDAGKSLIVKPVSSISTARSQLKQAHLRWKVPAAQVGPRPEQPRAAVVVTIVVVVVVVVVVVEVPHTPHAMGHAAVMAAPWSSCVHAPAAASA